MIRLLIVAVAMAALTGLTSPALAQQGNETWRDPDLGSNIAEGVATPRFLWLRGSNGGLVRFDRVSGERIVLATDARDILADGEKLWLLSGLADGYSLTLQDIRASEPAIAHLITEGQPIALLPSEGDLPDVLTTTSYLTREGDRWRRTDLAATLDRFAHVAADTSGALYVGYNRGEWGGGLRRIDPVTGAISFVSEPGAGLCGGLINPACQPVVGLFRDPQTPDCLIVGVGLAHMGSSYGHVYRVCGADIREIWTTPVNETGPQWALLQQRWTMDSLVETPDGWIGTSTDRYFLNHRDEIVERPMPAFEDWSGLRISQETDGVLFVVAACCWGSTDMALYRTLALPVAP